MSAPHPVLVLCTANEFRSPLTSHLLASVAGTGLVFTSAGLRAREGDPVAEVVRDLLAERGIDASGFRSRRVTDALLAEAGTVIAMTRAELSDALRLRPRALSSAVTLGELAAAAEHVGEAEWDALVATAIARRGTTDVDDVPDPSAAGQKVTEEVVARIVRCTDAIGTSIGAGLTARRR
ncbi:low molecular weight phosphatase family protein [Lentzea sp. NPDC059081]|uniref:arsenate-mycothiol transferase ArsC n=1 Tax=Lentzea sp. NPDC059081 TaxID=3346719 RepID=UPI003689E054